MYFVAMDTMVTTILHVLVCRGLNKIALPVLNRQLFREQQLIQRYRNVHIQLSKMLTSFTTIERGAPNSADYRLFFRENHLLLQTLFINNFPIHF
jgi:hypothetical protein